MITALIYSMQFQRNYHCISNTITPGHWAIFSSLTISAPWVGSKQVQLFNSDQTLISNRVIVSFQTFKGAPRPRPGQQSSWLPCDSRKGLDKFLTCGQFHNSLPVHPDGILGLQSSHSVQYGTLCQYLYPLQILWCYLLLVHSVDTPKQSNVKSRCHLLMLNHDYGIGFLVLPISVSLQNSFVKFKENISIDLSI